MSSVVYPVSTETEFRHAMARDYGHSVSGLGPKQSVDDVARAIVGVRAPAAPGGLPARMSQGARGLNAVGSGLHRSAGAQIQPAADVRRGPMEPDASVTDGLVTAIAIARASATPAGAP